MKTYNEIQLDDDKVGEKFTFLYEKSSKSKKKKDDDSKIKVRLKDDYFQKQLEKIKNNYPERKNKYENIHDGLSEIYELLESIKGKQDKESKAKRKELKEQMNEYFKKNSSGQDKKDNDDNILFFKRFSEKDIDKDNAYQVECWYAGKTMDKRNGKWFHSFITNTGYINKDDFDERIMEKKVENHDEKNNKEIA